MRNLHASRSADLAQLHGRQLGIAERAEMLEELSARWKASAPASKQVLEKAGLKRQAAADRESHSEAKLSLVARERGCRRSGYKSASSMPPPSTSRSAKWLKPSS